MGRPDYSALAEILEEMNKEGGFIASVVSSDNGLLIASATAPTTNQDIVAAMTGYVTSTIERMRNEFELGDLLDVTVRCSLGKVVFRKIISNGDQSFLIAAIIPRHIRYHTRIIGKAATKIRRIMAFKK